MRLLIKEFREEMFLTQKELAEKIGNLQRNVSNWENGISEPDCETIVKLADVFDVGIDELFGRSSKNPEARLNGAVEINVVKYVRKLSDTQKFALLQFLREMTSE